MAHDSMTHLQEGCSSMPVGLDRPPPPHTHTHTHMPGGSVDLGECGLIFLSQGYDAGDAMPQQIWEGNAMPPHVWGRGCHATAGMW